MTKKTPSQLIQHYKDIASEPPSTEAKTAFLKAIAAAEKAYMEFSAIRSAYAAQYPAFAGPLLRAARDQHDEAESAVDDSDEISQDLKSAIETLHDRYGAMAKDRKKARREATRALNKTRAPLAAAEGRVARRQARLDRAKTFEKRAKGWFDDVKKLAEEVKANSQEGANMRLAYAQFLELKAVYDDLILVHFENPDAAKHADPDWVLKRLNTKLRSLLRAEKRKYKRQSEADTAAARAKSAEDAFKSFVTDNGRRTGFLREAQDAEPQQASDASGGTSPSGGSGPTGGSGGSGSTGGCGAPSGQQPERTCPPEQAEKGPDQAPKQTAQRTPEPCD